MNLQILQTIAAVLAATAVVMGAFYTIFTRPLMNLFRAEINVLRQEINVLRQEIKAELAAMELRLNERIDTRIVRG